MSSERHRQVLDHGQLIEQHRTFADDAEVVDGGEPLCAVGNLRGCAAQHPHLSGVGQRRACNQVDENFGRRPIEAENRHLLAGGEAKVGDPQRAQPVVILRDGRELENRRAHKSRR